MAEKQLKQCCSCKEVNSIIFFNKNSSTKDCLSKQCKNCKKIFYEKNKIKILKKQKEYREKNNEKINESLRNYYNKNKEIYSIKSKENYEKNKEKIKERIKNYSEKNKDKIKERSKNYYINNKESINKKNKIYEEQNKEKMNIARKIYALKNDKKIKEYKKEWIKNDRKSNPLKYNERVKNYRKTTRGKSVQFLDRHKRRTIVKKGDINTSELSNIIKNTKVCYWCGISLKNVKTHLDHYYPLSKGGGHIISNIVVSCSKCNLSKSAKDPFEFAQSIGRLL